MRRKLAAGNWKMHGDGAMLDQVSALIAGLPDHPCEVLICPPATLIHRMAQAAGPVAVGGQECHAAEGGAHTGDISAGMLADAGATYVILGHSERRTDHGERDEDVQAKAQAAWSAGLTPIICVGETEAERDAGQTLTIIQRQVAQSVPKGATGDTLVIAYEPVWAIGTGRVPSLTQIAEVHDAIRVQLQDLFGEAVGQAIRLLYGGSVKPGNAAEIFAVSNVDGALVGGASLKAADFGAIIDALTASPAPSA